MVFHYVRYFFIAVGNQQTKSLAIEPMGGCNKLSYMYMKNNATNDANEDWAAPVHCLVALKLGLDIKI